MDLDRLGLEIKLVPYKGRGVFARREFQESAIIMEETPLIGCQFAWNQDLGYAACDHCLRPLESPLENVRRLCQDPTIVLPYTESFHTGVKELVRCICGATYCSNDCQAAADSRYHRALCFAPSYDKYSSLKNLKDIWKNIHYPPETTSVMLFIRIYSLIHQAEDKNEAIRLFQDFVSESTNADEGKWHRLLKAEHLDLLMQSVFECLRNLMLDIPVEFTTRESFIALFSLIATNGQGVGTSAFSQWVSHVDNNEVVPEDDAARVNEIIKDLYSRLEEVVGVDFLNNEGSALYRVQSKINHSCSPNVEVTFPRGDHTLALKALRNIHPGEELCSSYLDDCMLERSRHSRQKFLSENYLFQCHCSKCEEQSIDPDITSDEESEDDAKEDN